MSTAADDLQAMTQRSFFDRQCGSFFLAFRVLGICPYTRNRNGVFCKRVISNSAVYTLFSGVAFGYATATVVKSLYRPQSSIAISNFNQILLIFGYATFFSPSLIVPILMWFETSKLQVYLQEWQIFQDDYNRVIGESDGNVTLDVGNLADRIFQFIVGLLVISSFTLTWTSTQDMAVLVCTIKSVSTMAFITGFWYVSTKVIQATNENYKKKLEMESDCHIVHAYVIEDYRLLWIRMSRLVRDSGTYMSATMTFCICYMTVLTTLAVYTLTVWGVTLAELRDYNTLASTVAVLVASMASLYVYCDCGHRQTTNCVDSVILLILKIKSKMTWQNSNYIQITMFLNAVNQNQPNVNVNGFYEINRGLFGSILSLLVTYLIVLIQLNSSFTTSNTEYNNNNTI